MNRCIWTWDFPCPSTVHLNQARLLSRYRKVWVQNWQNTQLVPCWCNTQPCSKHKNSCMQSIGCRFGTVTVEKNNWHANTACGFVICTGEKCAKEVWNTQCTNRDLDMNKMSNIICTRVEINANRQYVHWTTDRPRETLTLLAKSNVTFQSYLHLHLVKHVKDCVLFRVYNFQYFQDVSSPKFLPTSIDQILEVSCQPAEPHKQVFRSKLASA